MSCIALRLEPHELAGPAADKVDRPLSTADRDRARHLAVLPHDLARAGRRGLRLPARVARARRDRLPAAGGADAGGGDPDAARVLRDLGVLPRRHPALAGGAREAQPERPHPHADLRRDLPASVVGGDARGRLSAAAGRLALAVPPRLTARLRAAPARVSRARLD